MLTLFSSSIIRRTAFAVTLLCTGGTFAQAEALNSEQRKEIESLIRSYLLEHPELLQEMVVKLDEQQKKAEAEKRTVGMATYTQQIFHDANDFVAGNPKGDVTLVEFFDYNCGWCKRGFPEIMSLVDSDKNLRLVLKEFPIFGDDSEYAASAAMASKAQGKYWQFHQALFKFEGKITKAAVDEIAAAEGLDMARLKKDMASPEIAKALADNQALAQSLAINGTPAFVVGDKLIPGYVPASELSDTIADVRKRGACKQC